MNFILKTNTIDINDEEKEVDRLLIPNVIYDDTISRNTDELIKYFINNPNLTVQFVGFNGALKLSNQLASQQKCSCFYTVPWVTQFAYLNNKDKTILLFNQQLKQYRYMIRYWYPSPQQSYMRYLSSIALNIILNIKRYSYNSQNNLNTENVYFIYSDYFTNEQEFRIYVNIILKKLIYLKI